MDNTTQQKEHLGLRVDAELKKALEEIAKENKRSLSSQVEWMLEQILQNNQ